MSRFKVINRKEYMASKVLPSLPYMGIARRAGTDNPVTYEEIEIAINAHKKRTYNVYDALTSTSDMFIAAKIAQYLLPIEPMPKSAEAIYYLDVEKEQRMEDPKNPFSSNYDGTDVGPDSFGGSDEGSHYMSNISAAKIREELFGESHHDCTSTEEMKEEMKKNLPDSVEALRQIFLEHEKMRAAGIPYVKRDGHHVTVGYPNPVDRNFESSITKKKEMKKTSDQIEEIEGPCFKNSNEPRWRQKGHSLTIGPARPLDPNFKPAIDLSVEPVKELYSSPFDTSQLVLPNDNAWIQLHSGRKFYPLEPKLEDIDIEDIAHSLSNMCRFTGHCKDFYSVAQHSVLVSYLCSPENALWGLLHDASEAYIVDVPKPLKRLPVFEGYRELEKTIQEMICEKFGLSNQEPPAVKVADNQMLATEARDLMGPLHPEWIQPCSPLPFKIEALSPAESKKLFLNRYRGLVGGDIGGSTSPPTVKSIMDDK